MKIIVVQAVKMKNSRNYVMMDGYGTAPHTAVLLSMSYVYFGLVFILLNLILTLYFADNTFIVLIYLLFQSLSALLLVSELVLPLGLYHFSRAL